MAATASALIGYTGFVGSHVAAQHPFELFFNSRNVEEIVGRSFDLLVVSAMPAAMWIANGNPQGDRAILDRLITCLRQTYAEQVVLMSTIAVYPAPFGVTEDSPIEREAQTPYGRHRLILEEAIAGHFPRVLSVRLPGIFGRGLKKNVVFDLLHGNELYKLHSLNSVQYYDLEWVWSDVEIALAAGLKLVNFATEPLSIAEMAGQAFGIEFSNDPGTPPALFDMRSLHAQLYGGSDGYLYSRAKVLESLREFVRRERSRKTVA